MSRRAVRLVLALALMHCVPSSAAGQPAKTNRIGCLLYSPAAASSERLAEYRHALADFGWVEGRNLVIEQRSAESQNDRLPELAADLVRSGVSVIVAENSAATRSFELVINAKAAKAIGLTFPPSLLRRADRIIE